MKVIELLKSKEWSGKVIDCVLRFALSFALAGAQVFGGYAPLALGMIGASGAGLRGVSALIGASAGAVLFLPFSHALRTFAAGVLIFTANNAFFDLKLYKKRAFLPLLCAGMMFSVEFVYVLRDGVGEAANCLMALLLCALGAMSGRALLSTGDKEKEDHPYAPLFILLGVLMAASSFETADGFAPGRILSMLAVLLFAFERGSAFAIPAALCIGLGMDLGAGGGSFVHAASYAFSAVLVNVTARGNRVASALWFALSILCFALPMNAHAGLVLLYEGLAATLLFLLIPSRFLRGKRLCSDEAAQEDAAVRRKIAASAAAPRTLTEENPAAIFDRAAEKVCRGCALCSYCWEKEYQRTYTALNDATAALLRRGQGRGEDFPSYFSERCIHFSSFLSAVNGELRAYLLRRQYRRQLEETRRSGAMPPELQSVQKALSIPDMSRVQIGSVLFANKPGDGSAREQAASCQRVLGGCANLCYEFATKRYRSNCVNWGMLPFTLAEGTDFPGHPGDFLYVPQVREKVTRGDEEFPALLLTDSGIHALTLYLKNTTAEERELLLTGCLMNHYAAQNAAENRR